MVRKKDQETKDAILKAAREVFIDKGLDGARMQEIADRAGINKALLHYYFSTKENLFDAIFMEAFSQFAPQVQAEITQATSMRQFLRTFIRIYIKMLIERPYLPIFILSELHRNPDRPARLVIESGINPEKVMQMLQAEMDEGRVVTMDPRELITNVLSLCIFPFAARPMTQRILWRNDAEAYDRFLEQRSESVYLFLERSLFLNKN